MSVSLPEDILQEVKEKYSPAVLRNWARAVLIREAIRTGLVSRSVGRALIRAGLTDIVPADPVEFVGGSEDVA